MRVIPESVDAVKTNFRRPVRPGAVGTIRVDVQHQEQKTLEAVNKTEDGSSGHEFRKSAGYSPHRRSRN